MRQFNTAGPTVAADHYSLDPLQRINLDEILNLISQKRYFVLYAPRQTGKTTCLLALMRYLNKEGSYRAIYANIENAQTTRDDVSRGLRTVCSQVASSLRMHLGDNQTADKWLDILSNHGSDGALLELLRAWTESDLSRPTVLMFDEIDVLVGDTLISVLRQIRAGYADRPEHFPISVILCGVRDVIFGFLDDAAEIGVKGISFVSDGESSCSPHLYDAILRGRANGLDIALGSNGYLLDDERLADILPA